MQHFGDFPVQWNKQKISKKYHFSLENKEQTSEKNFKIQLFFSSFKNGQWI